MKKTKLRNILLTLLIVAISLSAFAVFSFATASDITTHFSETFSGCTIGTTGTASATSSYFSLGSKLKFSITKTKHGKAVISGDDTNKYAVITHEDYCGSSGPYVFIDSGKVATVSSDKTTFTKSNEDISNYKYMMFEVDVMSPTGKFPNQANIGFEGRYVNTSGSASDYWNNNATDTIVLLRNESNGEAYLQQNGNTSVKKYINPYKFTRIQIIVENVSTDDTESYQIKSHVYVDGELWFTKEATNEKAKSDYLGGIPNAVFKEVRINTKSSTTNDDPSQSLAIDNVAYKTVPRNSTTAIDALVYEPDEEPANLVEYVSGGKTVTTYGDKSLANAFATADAGTTIKLLADCQHNDGMIAVTKNNMTLDLNGYTIDATIDRNRRDTGLFEVTANLTFTLTSSRPGAKIFSAALSNGGDPVIVPRANSKINVIGRNDEGETTLSFYGSSFIRDYKNDSGDVISIDGGEYYRLGISDNGIINLMQDFTFTARNAFFYHNANDSADGVFTFNGRFNIGGTKISNATIDNCVIISNTNIVSHAYKNANILFTNSFISGDISPATYSGQTAGVVTLGDGCAVDGNLSANVVTADGLAKTSVPNLIGVSVKRNTFVELDGKITDASFEINELNYDIKFDTFVTATDKIVTLVWCDENGSELARTLGVRGKKITYTPYSEFVEKGAFIEYIEGWVNALPDEWCEDMNIPADYDGAEYTLTYKRGGKTTPYKGIFPVLFNIAAEIDTRVNIFIPKAPEGIEYTSVYINDKIVYGYDDEGNFIEWQSETTLKGIPYHLITEQIGIISAGTEKIKVSVNFTCDGNNLTSSFASDMSSYCNTVLNDASYSEQAKTLAVNIANYLVSGVNLAGKEYTAVTEALAKIVDSNEGRLVAPPEQSLVLPEGEDIGKYVYSVHIEINDDGPSFVFTLTDAGKASAVELSTSVGNGPDESYSTVGYIKTGNDRLTNIYRTTITVIPEGDAPVSLVYSLANYCKALEGTKGEELSRALYGFVKSQMAYKNISDLSIEKSASYSESITANIGEEIEYSINVTNHESVAKTFTVKDTVPENTTYVGGADSFADGKLEWNVTLGSGESVTLTYKVKINEDITLYDGGVVESTVASAENAEARANPVYIERTFNEADRKYIDIAIDALSASTFTDITLAKWIYYVAYSQSISLASTTSITDNLDCLKDGTASASQLDKIAPTLYGGKSITGAIEGVKGAPTSYVSEADLIVGDIILTEVGGVGKCYMYASDGLYLLDIGCEKVDTYKVLLALTSSDTYAVFRISAGLTNFTPTDMNATPDTLTDIQQVIVNTAKYYLQRGEWLQYDDTYLAYGNTALGNESRWEAGLATPEERTSQDIGYINCAAFTHDVYWTVFGQKLPNGMYTTANLTNNSAQNNMKMYSFTRNATDTHTEEEKAKVKSEFMSTLQPGDIMVILRGSSGHAMLYIGDGLFIHSTGSSYDYGTSVETYEPTIRYHRVNDYFFNEASTSGYVFGQVTSLCIVRPLNNTKWAGYKVTENAQNRVDNLMGITAEKLPSVGKAVSVNPGDEITYTFSIRNDNSEAKTLEITDKLSSFVEYVNGADRIDGDTVYFTVNVPANSTVAVSYTVKVLESTPYGTAIEANDATVGGVIHNTYPTYVRRTLTVAEQTALVERYNELVKAGTTLRGIELVNELYKSVLGIEKAYADIDVEALTQGAENGIFTAEGLGTYSNGRQAYQINKESIYYNLVAEGLYGGRGVSSKPNENIRTELPKKEHLVIGDVLVGRYLSGYSIYIYLGGDTLVNLTTLANDTSTVDKRLEKMPSYVYHFAILRTSYIAEE